MFCKVKFINGASEKGCKLFRGIFHSCGNARNEFLLVRAGSFFPVEVDNVYVRHRYYTKMSTKKETEWVKRFCSATNLLEWQKLVAGLQAASSDEVFRWRVLHACLKHFVELETKNFECQVYEYCLAVFKIFEPGLSPERERELDEEIERRVCVVSAQCTLDLGSLSASEKELMDLVKAGKISVDDLIKRSSDIKSSRAWAVLNFFLYSVLYAQKYGKIPGGAFAVPIGIAVGALSRLVIAR